MDTLQRLYSDAGFYDHISTDLNGDVLEKDDEGSMWDVIPSRYRCCLRTDMWKKRQRERQRGN